MNIGWGNNHRDGSEIRPRYSLPSLFSSGFVFFGVFLFCYDWGLMAEALTAKLSWTGSNDRFCSAGTRTGLGSKTKSFNFCSMQPMVVSISANVPAHWHLSPSDEASAALKESSALLKVSLFAVKLLPYNIYALRARFKENNTERCHVHNLMPNVTGKRVVI